MSNLSQMPKHFMKKVQESIKSHATQSQRIPPSGTPVKAESNDLPSSRIRFFNDTVKNEPHSPSSNTSRNLSNLEDMCRNEEYVQIAFLKSRFVEITHIFLSFPKSHIDGYAYIIELSPEILNEKAILSLRDALSIFIDWGRRTQAL